MSTIHERTESARGCGYRKPGGIYLIGGRLSAPCGKLPIPLSTCPCCGAGIKPARGFTWVSSAIIEQTTCKSQYCTTGCVPFDGSVKRFGLLWIGEAFYKTVGDFRAEAALQGISRRISQIPKDLVVGETWILLAHRKAIEEAGLDPGSEVPIPVVYTPAIFSAFIPERIEYVVKGTETEEELLALEKRGLTLVRVNRAFESQLALETEEGDDI